MSAAAYVQFPTLFSPRPESAHEARMGEVIGQGVARMSGQACSGRSPIGRGHA